MLPTRFPTFCAKLTAIFDTEDEGEGDRCIHDLSSPSSSFRSSGSIPTDELAENPFRKGEGGRPDGRGSGSG